MATNQTSFSFSLDIRKNNLVWRPQPFNYRGTVSGTERGPYPGALLVSTAGVDVDLTQLTTPGLTIIRNLDSSALTTHYIEAGIWDGTKFYPLMELMPGEAYPLRLSRYLGNAYGSGTGTTGSGKRLRLKACGAAAYASVEAFEA